eukprot:scaffold3564_cov46-Phaeocystis_antarctica.AAC.1
MVGQRSTVQHSSMSIPVRRHTVGTKLQTRICTARASRLPGGRSPPIVKGPLRKLRGGHDSSFPARVHFLRGKCGAWALLGVGKRRDTGVGLG